MENKKQWARFLFLICLWKNIWSLTIMPKVAFEYFDGEVFEMSGESPEHALLGSRIGYLLNKELIPKGCSVYSSDAKIKVLILPPYRYGDITALCEKPIYEEVGNQRLLVNPTLIVELLLPSTEKYDLDKKFVAYKSVESLNSIY